MFASLFQKVAPKSRPASPRRARLAVEVLEGRAVPSTVLTSNALHVAVPDAHVAAHFGSAGPGVHVQASGIGEEIPQHSGSAGLGVHVEASGIGEEIPQLATIGEEIPS